MLIIGFSGKKHSGKTTAVDEVWEYLIDKGYNWNDIITLSFATPLKQIVTDCFTPSEWNLEVVDLDEEKEKTRVTPCGKTIRELLQIIGTDMFRELFANVWINALFNKIKKEYADKKIILITDVRFENEALKIQSENGKLIRFTRAPFQNSDQHPSETALDEYGKFDYVINNIDISLKEKTELLKEIIDEILIGE